MKILLLNENPMVSRLINLSAKKMSYEVTETASYSEELGTYDTIIVDSDTEADLKALKEKCKQLIFLTPRDKDCEVDAKILHKPFLPTDFLNLLSGGNLDDSISVEPIDESDFDEDPKGLDPKVLETTEDLPEDLSLESLSLDEDEQAEETQEDLKAEDLSFDDSDEESLKTQEEEDLKTEYETKQDLEQARVQNDEEPKEELEGLEESLEKSLEAKVEEKPFKEESSKEEPPAEKPEEPLEEAPLVEVQEKELDFDDLPKDAEFLGQEKPSLQREDFLPFIEEDLSSKDEFATDLSAQDQIKEELAELAQLDTPEEDASKLLEEFKDEPILSLNEEKLGIGGEELVVPRLDDPNDFDALKESEIQRALGEEVSEEDYEIPQTEHSQAQGSGEEDETEKSELVEELSRSIAQTIASSIKDDSLKAALKGMNMNINIKISFEEGKN